jgi:hypothetical protein
MLIKNYFHLLIILCLVSLPLPCLSETDYIGSLRKTKGPVSIITPQGDVKKTKDGDYVYQGDTVKTEKKGSVGIIFRDNSRISLGSDSELELTKYIYQPRKKKFGMLSKLSKGTASYLSGKLSKLSPDSVRFKTPDATIGARGTSLFIKVEED